MGTYVKPTSDIFIRYLFGSEENKDLLLDFINAVLEDADFPLIHSVEILNPFNLKQFLKDKESILDVKAVDVHEKIFNIEIQAIGNEAYVNRAVYYWAKTYTAQLETGEAYRKLNPVISINILEFSIIPDYDKTHTVFLPLEKDNPDIRLSEHFEIHFIEFPKFSDTKTKLKSHLQNWLVFLKEEGREPNNMRTVLENNEAIQKAHEQYKKFTGNDEYREAYEARMKWQRDHNTLMESAREQGQAEGKLHSKLETAHNLVDLGVPLETILKATGLSEEQLREHGIL